MRQSDHALFAIGAMLGKDPGAYIPLHWAISGVPRTALDLAMEGGADPKAIIALEDGVDPRLYAMMFFGWVRVSQNRFNLWDFNQSTAELIRECREYWKAQDYGPDDMIDVFEFKTKDRFQIRITALLKGGDPKILKNLSMGRMDADKKTEALSPAYSSKLSELERRRLYARVGDNPTPALEAEAQEILHRIAAKEHTCHP